jgi:hypothetical protein
LEAIAKSLNRKVAIKYTKAKPHRTHLERLSNFKRRHYRNNVFEEGFIPPLNKKLSPLARFKTVELLYVYRDLLANCIRKSAF